MARKQQQQRSKVGPALLVAGVAGGVVTAIRRRGAGKKVEQAASQVADKAGDLAERAKAAAPEPVQQAVEKVQGGGESGSAPATEESPRYAAPAQAGSQPPATPGGSPSDQPTVLQSTAASPSEDLQTKAHSLPDDVVMPDMSDDDPNVRAAETAAAADAGAIGGNVDQMAIDEPAFPEDAATRPVIEGSGDDETNFAERDAELGGNRETQP